MYQDNNQPVSPPPFYGGKAVAQQANSIMKRVYVRMFIGMLISAFCALGVASSPSMLAFFFSNRLMYWLLFGVMLIMAIVIPARLNRLSTGSVMISFCLFSALMGVSLAPIFIVYRIGTIVYTFFITAGVFGAMSVYGYFTKQDLTKIGSFLVMALFGLFFVMIVNIFAKSSQLDWIISIVGVVIFIGLTAWDTQNVKKLARYNMDPALVDKLATMSAMNLYLDFINMFLFLLRIFGNSND